MKISSKLVNWGYRISNQYSSLKFGKLNPVSNSSNSSPSIEKTVEINQFKTDTINSDQNSYLIPLENDEEIVQWSSAVKSLLEEPPSNLPQQLFVGGFAFLLSFSVWAWFGEIEKTGKAQGKLVPKGEIYKIESIESAKVSYIAVKEGEQVKAGQLIAKLDSEQEEREIERLQSLLLSSQTELNQKHNLLEKVAVETKTHQLIARAEVQAQQSAIASAVDKAKVTSQLLAQQQLEMAAYVNRKKHLGNLSALEREKYQELDSELKEHQQRLQRLEPLAEEGAISQEFIFQAKQARRQTQQQLIDNKLQGISNISEQIFQSEQSLREMEARITQSRGEIFATRTEIERLKAELEHKKAERRRIELEAQQKVQQLELEIGQTKTKITETKNLLAKAKTELDKRFLKSPVAGTVLSFNVRNTGKVVQSGETVAEIAPHDSPLVLSTLLPNKDAGFIEEGMTAQVKFDAYSYQDYGVIPGKVISISPDTKIDEKLGAAYRVKIELERNYITNDLKKILFKPGQTATADIVIRRRRVMDVLLDPIKKLEKDGINL